MFIKKIKLSIIISWITNFTKYTQQIILKWKVFSWPHKEFVTHLKLHNAVLKSHLCTGRRCLWSFSSQNICVWPGFMLLARLQLGCSGFAQNVRGTKGPAAPPPSSQPTKSLRLTDACMQTTEITHRPISHSDESITPSICYISVCAVGYTLTTTFIFKFQL